MKEEFVNIIKKYPGILKDIRRALAIEKDCSENVIDSAINKGMKRFDISEAEAYYDLILYNFAEFVLSEMSE